MKQGLEKSRFIICFLLFCMSAFAQLAIAATPAQPTLPPIKIGSTSALSGVVADHGENVTLGTQLYFNRINQAGGIQGRKIEFIVLDNKYEPEVAGRLTRQLIEKDNVLALVGLHGSAIVAVILPIVTEMKTLLFGVWSGPESLYKLPVNRYVMNFRASYGEEITETINGLLSIGVKPSEFAFFAQGDPSGDSVYAAAIKALKAAGYQDAYRLPHGRYARNTLNVELALADILDKFKKTPPKIILLSGLAEPNEKFFALARKEFPRARFVVISGQLDPHSLTKNDEEYVIATQVVPPLTLDLPAVKEYKEDLHKYGKGAEPSYTSFYTYIAARIFVAGLQQAVTQNKLTREGIIDVLENLSNVDIGIGVPLSYSKTNHTAMHKVWVTVYKNGEFVPTTWPELKKIISP